MNPAMILKKWFIDQGIGVAHTTNADWRTYAPGMPDDDTLAYSKVISVGNTTPVQDGRLGEGDVVEHPGVQIMIRSNDYNAGWDKGKAIEEALAIDLTGDQVTFDGEVYTIDEFTKTSGLTYIRQTEKNKRSEFTINGTLTLLQQ